MPPKRAQEEGDKDALIVNLKTQLEDLQSLNEALRKRFEELSTATEYARGISLEKEAEVRKLQKESLDMQKEHEREIAVMQEEAVTAQADAEFRIKCLEMEILQLNDQLESNEGLVDRNKKLLNENEILHRESERRARDRHREVDDLNAQMVEHKVKLEKEFRDRLSDLSKSLADQNGDGLGADHRRALEFNKALLRRFNETTDQVRSVVEKYNSLERDHKKLRVEMELSDQNRNLQLLELLESKKNLNAARERCVELENTLRDVRSESNHIAQLQSKIRDLEFVCQSAETEIRRLQSENKELGFQMARWKKRATQGPKLIVAETISPTAKVAKMPELVRRQITGGDRARIEQIWNARYAETDGRNHWKLGRPSTTGSVPLGVGLDGTELDEGEMGGASANDVLNMDTEDVESVDHDDDRRRNFGSKSTLRASVSRDGSRSETKKMFSSANMDLPPRAATAIPFSPQSRPRSRGFAGAAFAKAHPAGKVVRLNNLPRFFDP